MESKIWDLYTLAQDIIQRRCKDKCFHYGFETIEDCKDYVVRRMLHNKANVLQKFDGSKSSETTYLYTFVSSKIIDFFNSAAQKKRGFFNEDSINNMPDETVQEEDYSEIMEQIFSLLSPKETLYMKLFYLEGYSAKEIEQNVGRHTAKQINKILEGTRNKLKKTLGYSLEEIL